MVSDNPQSNNAKPADGPSNGATKSTANTDPKTNRTGMSYEAHIVFEHKHNIDQVMETFFKKYPSEEFKDVLECKVLEDTTDPETKKRFLRREMVVRNTAPWIFRTIVGAPVIIFRENATIDSKHKTLHTESQNVTFSSIIQGKEVSDFRIHPQNPSWTLFEQVGGVTASSYFGPLKGGIEMFVGPTFKVQGEKACKLLDTLLFKYYPLPPEGSAPPVVVPSQQSSTAGDTEQSPVPLSPAERFPRIFALKTRFSAFLSRFGQSDVSTAKALNQQQEKKE